MTGTATVIGMTTGGTTATMGTMASLHHQEGARHKVSLLTSWYLMLSLRLRFACLLCQLLIAKLAAGGWKNDECT
jgi:hypothetical protein